MFKNTKTGNVLIMSCTHPRKKFIGLLEYRYRPEKVFLCEECGMTISDFITTYEINHLHFDNHFIPQLELLP